MLVYQSVEYATLQRRRGVTKSIIGGGLPWLYSSLQFPLLKLLWSHWLFVIVKQCHKPAIFWLMVKNTPINMVKSGWWILLLYWHDQFCGRRVREFQRELFSETIGGTWTVLGVQHLFLDFWRESPYHSFLMLFVCLPEGRLCYPFTLSMGGGGWLSQPFRWCESSTEGMVLS